MSGKLAAAAGLGGFDLEALSEEERGQARALLVQAARSFLLGGGWLTLDDWAGLCWDERAAAAAAGDALRREFAVMSGAAARSELEAADVIAPVDGGAQLEETLLATMAQQQRGGGR